jgi:hypothetical protein
VTDTEMPNIEEMDIGETVESLDKAIEEMGERIADGEFDDENEQLRIDRLNALSNAVDAKRRLIDELPEYDLGEIWRDALEE